MRTSIHLKWEALFSAKTLWTISFNYSISARPEGLRGARQNPKGVREWQDGNTSVVFEAEYEWWMLGVLMDLHCQCFHVLMINSSVSAMMHSRTVLCAVDGWIEPSLLIAPVLSPPETPEDQITSSRAWWNHGTKSSIKHTTFTWFYSIISDVIKPVWLRKNRSCRELPAGAGTTHLRVWEQFLKVRTSDSWLFFFTIFICDHFYSKQTKQQIHTQTNSQTDKQTKQKQHTQINQSNNNEYINKNYQYPTQNKHLNRHV